MPNLKMLRGFLPMLALVGCVAGGSEADGVDDYSSADVYDWETEPLGFSVDADGNVTSTDTRFSAPRPGEVLFRKVTACGTNTECLELPIRTAAWTVEARAASVDSRYDIARPGALAGSLARQSNGAITRFRTAWQAFCGPGNRECAIAGERAVADALFDAIPPGNGWAVTRAAYLAANSRLAEFGASCRVAFETIGDADDERTKYTRYRDCLRTEFLALHERSNATGLVPEDAQSDVFSHTENDENALSRQICSAIATASLYQRPSQRGETLQARLVNPLAVCEARFYQHAARRLNRKVVVPEGFGIPARR